MRTFLFFVSLFISFSITLFSQEFQWADKAGGYYSDQGYDIAVEIICYPNPANDILHIEIEPSGMEHENIYLRITNTDGKLIFVEQAEQLKNPGSIDIDTINYAKGLYILYIYSGKGKYNTKFLVQ